jgi:hypothetical protein
LFPVAGIGFGALLSLQSPHFCILLATTYSYQARPYKAMLPWDCPYKP